MDQANLCIYNIYRFESTKVGQTMVAKMLPTLTMLVSNTRYTNNSVRPSSITNMKKGHIEDRKIMDITGHKKVETLSHYNSEISSFDRRTASTAICNPLPAKENPPVPTMVSGANLYLSVQNLSDASPNILLDNVPHDLNRFDKLSLQFYKFGHIRGIQVKTYQIFIEAKMF